jgi:hypothetical protein
MNPSEIVGMIEEYFPVTEAQRNWKPAQKDFTIIAGLTDILNKENK